MSVQEREQVVDGRQETERRVRGPRRNARFDQDRPAVTHGVASCEWTEHAIFRGEAGMGQSQRIDHLGPDHPFVVATGDGGEQVAGQQFDDWTDPKLEPATLKGGGIIGPWNGVGLFGGEGFIMQRLTGDGMNLEGVRRVMALTQEVERLQAAVAALEGELRAQARRHRQELDKVRRSARRDLVPYSSAIVRYEHPSRYSQA
jgi:hypothetical protein